MHLRRFTTKINLLSVFSSMYSPESILAELINQQPKPLSELPNDQGIYALIDHEGEIRYIGVTESPNMGFKRRIYQYHVTGSEGRSHKFSQAYNTGRMWRSRTPLPDQIPLNAKQAKSLRTKFCRKYCKAAYVSIPIDVADGDYFYFLTTLERKIQAHAPSSMRLWEGIKFQPTAEPTNLVDSLIKSIGLTSTEINSVNSQALLENRKP